MAKEKSLIPITDLVTSEAFKEGGMMPTLERIKVLAMAHVPDLTTAKGRKAIASNTRAVVTTKGMILDEGKALKKRIKAKFDEEMEPINGEMLIAESFLNDVRDESRKVLTDWEAAEKKRKAEAIAAQKQAALEAEIKAQYEKDFDDATHENDLIDKEKALDKKMAEAEAIINKEAARKAIQAGLEAAQAEFFKAWDEALTDDSKVNEAREAAAKEKAEREEKLKAEAAAKAKADAEAKAAAEKALAKFLTDFDEAIAMDKTFNLERERARADAKAKADREFQSYCSEFDEAERMNLVLDGNRLRAKQQRDAEAAAKKAEAKRLADIEEAKRVAKAEAEAKAAREAKAKQDEIDRLKKIEAVRVAAEKAEEEAQAKRDADKAHRGEINRLAMEHVMKFTKCTAEQAQEFVKSVIKGEAGNMTITY